MPTPPLRGEQGVSPEAREYGYEAEKAEYQEVKAPLLQRSRPQKADFGGGPETENHARLQPGADGPPWADGDRLPGPGKPPPGL